MLLSGINQSLEGKKVKVTLNDNSIFIGTVGDYIYPEDNEGVASIILDDCEQQPHPTEIYKNEIKSLEIF